jgi:hypothetical protein
MVEQVERLAQLIAGLPGISGSGIPNPTDGPWPTVWFTVRPDTTGFTALGIIAKAYLEFERAPGDEFDLDPLQPLIVRFVNESNWSAAVPGNTFFEVDCFGKTRHMKRLADSLEVIIAEAATA